VVAGSITLYEGSDVSEERLNEYPISDQPDNVFTGKPFPSDEAKSAVLQNVRAGVRIKLFDDDHGSERKGVAEIIIKKPIAEYNVNSFEQNIDDQYITMKYNGKKLAGKVSRIEIRTPSDTPATPVTFAPGPPPLP
jgi:hypothetical protein